MIVPLKCPGGVIREYRVHFNAAGTPESIYSLPHGKRTKPRLLWASHEPIGSTAKRVLGRIPRIRQ